MTVNLKYIYIARNSGPLNALESLLHSQLRGVRVSNRKRGGGPKEGGREGGREGKERDGETEQEEEECMKTMLGCGD